MDAEVNAEAELLLTELLGTVGEGDSRVTDLLSECSGLRRALATLKEMEEGAIDDTVPKGEQADDEKRCGAESVQAQGGKETNEVVQSEPLVQEPSVTRKLHDDGPPTVPGTRRVVELDDEAVQEPDSLSPGPPSPLGVSPINVAAPSSALGTKLRSEQHTVDTIVRNIQAIIEEDAVQAKAEVVVQQAYECKVHERMLATAEEDYHLLLGEYRSFRQTTELAQAEHDVVAENLQHERSLLTNLKTTLEAQCSVAAERIEALEAQLVHHTGFEAKYAVSARSCEELKIRDAQHQAERDLLRAELQSTKGQLEEARTEVLKTKFQTSELEGTHTSLVQRIEELQHEHKKTISAVSADAEGCLSAKHTLEQRLENADKASDASRAECLALKQDVENLKVQVTRIEAQKHAALEREHLALDREQSVLRDKANVDKEVECLGDANVSLRTELETLERKLHAMEGDLSAASIDYSACHGVKENLLSQLATEREETERSKASLLARLDEQEEHIQMSIRRDRGFQWEQRNVDGELRAYDAAVSAERANAENTSKALQSLEADYASFKSTAWAREESLRQEVHQLRQTADAVAVAHRREVDLFKVQCTRAAQELFAHKAATLVTQEVTTRDLIANEERSTMQPLLIQATLASTRSLLKRKKTSTTGHGEGTTLPPRFRS